MVIGRNSKLIFTTLIKEINDLLPKLKAIMVSQTSWIFTKYKTMYMWAS